MSQLASRPCVPCSEGAEPLEDAQIEPLLAQLDPDWKIVEGHHLARPYAFKNFGSGLAFVNRVGEMAEDQGHHPDITLAWGRVRVEIWTHKINGLDEADFIFAAKCDELYPRT